MRHIEANDILWLIEYAIAEDVYAYRIAIGEEYANRERERIEGIYTDVQMTKWVKIS